MNDLDRLIDDIEIFTSQSRLNELLRQDINELIASALTVMGIRTINDTGSARRAFVKLCADYLNRDISYIEEETESLWGNEERDVDTWAFVDEGKGRYMGIAIDDEGLFGQEFYGTPSGLDGKVYPSPMRPDRDRYEPNHITTVCDAVDDGRLMRFEMYVNKIEDLFVDILEGR